MKRNIALLLVLLLATSCTSKTEYGRCIGINEIERPELIYKPSVKNIMLGAFFFQMILPPIFVLGDQFYCPVGRK